MRDTFKKIITTISITMVLVFNTLPTLAYDIPSAPEAPSSPEAPVAPEAPAAPEAPTAPEAPSGTTTPDTSSIEPAPSPSAEPTDTTTEPTLPPTTDDPTTPLSSTEEQTTSESDTSSSSPTSESQTLSDNPAGNQTGDQSADEQVGSTTLDTGDATNSVAIVSDANNNLTDPTIGSEDTGGISVVNSDNGANSNNSGSASIVEDSTTIQDNQASVTNSLTQTTTSGDNSASKNVGDTTITTGDANTTGTIINAANTNIDRVMVAEFNVVDDQVGDLVLDFSANCIASCSSGNLLAENSGNGAGSNNDASIDLTQDSTTFQNNDATLLNEMNLSSNTGDNEADKNVGDSEIKTGNANVEANLLNFANNNLTGGVILGVVNIFGDLIGDIILPEEYLASASCSTCPGNLTAANTGNGADSENLAAIDQTATNNTFQKNDATIENNILVDASTGSNEVSKNTGGDSSIETGEASVDVNVLNVANSNISGGDWWLVLVNEAGNWIGKILGGNGQNYAGSEGTQFIVNEFGEITAVNSGNGADSQNSSSVSQTSNNTLSQTNTANIVNNVNLSANTGGNSASKNTGGDSSITTGDANIVANIVNFVNNNISGGRLYVTVVNVFGSWIGDFITPGSEKDNQIAENQSSGETDNSGGTNNSTGGNSNNNSSGNSSATGENNNSTTNPNLPSTQTPTTNRPSVPIRIAGFVAGVEGVETPEASEVDNLTGGITKVQRKKIKINLAWLLPVVPLGLLLLWLRRRVKINKSKYLS